jgi:hypothetical protein
VRGRARGAAAGRGESERGGGDRSRLDVVAAGAADSAADGAQRCAALPPGEAAVARLRRGFSVRGKYEHVFVSTPTSERNRAIAEAWAGGVELAEICRRFQLSKGRVSTIAKAMGLKQRQPRPTDHEVARFKEMYAAGRTVTEIASKTRWHRGTVARHLRLAGVRVRTGGELARQWPVRHDAFSPPLDAEAWYWLGFLAADGSVSGTCVTLTQKNACEPVLRRFLAFLGSGARPLQSVGYGTAKRAMVCSRQLVADLRRHGVVPRKTYVLKASSEAARESAFWLGVFDGDGSITISSDGVPKISLFGTEALMLQFRDFMAQRDVTARRHAVCRRRNELLWQVRAQGETAMRLARLWLDSWNPSLEEKRARLVRAASYTHARSHTPAARRRRCDWCGAWIERSPSRFKQHAFCSMAHFRRWSVRHRQALSMVGQLSFGAPAS